MLRSRRAVVGIVSVAVLAPTALSLLAAGALAHERGTDEFYGAAVGVLSALLVAYALQFEMFLAGLYRLVGRGDRLLILPLLVT